MRRRLRVEFPAVLDYIFLALLVFGVIFLLAHFYCVFDLSRHTV